MLQRHLRHRGEPGEVAGLLVAIHHRSNHPARERLVADLQLVGVEEIKAQLLGQGSHERSEPTRGDPHQHPGPVKSGDELPRARRQGDAGQDLVENPYR